MENISVSVRVRPLNKLEAHEGFAWKLENNAIFQIDPNTKEIDRTRDQKYTLDHIFGPEWTTTQVYEATTQKLIHKMVKGFNSTVFAYGQTSSGKTFSMRGVPGSPGLIPLAVKEAFDLIEASQDREYLIRVSYMEIYNEEVNDLLAPESVKLPVHESKENGPYVCGLREDIVTSPEQVLVIIETGESNRHVGATKMNETSSRSHTIFRMVVESRACASAMDEGADSAVLVSVLTLVDLAGSERVAKTGAEGIRMKEGTAINKSLLTLGNVINKLSEGALATGGHIPYRDSKLTRILQPSLGGNAKTSIICAMTPAGCHIEESHSTLRFACRAKRVVNNAIVNEVLSDAAVLKRQAHEIEELKKRLAESGMLGHVEDQINALRAQLLRSEQEKELMRSKLAEEKQQREKAQKQAEIAKKLIIEGMGPKVDDSSNQSKRNTRRETWCPGNSAYGPPIVALGALPEEQPQACGSERSGRKRSHSRLDADGSAARGSAGERAARGSAADGLSVLAEEDEEEAGGSGSDADGPVSGPTPQRRRRERTSISQLLGEDSGAVDSDATPSDDNATDAPPTASGTALPPKLQRLLNRLAGSERRALESMVAQWRERGGRVGELQAQVEELVDASTRDSEELRSTRLELETAAQSCDALNTQVETLKWQMRQAERKLEDQFTATRTAVQAHDALQESMEQEQAASNERLQALQARVDELSEQRASLKESTKALRLEAAGLRAEVELKGVEAGLREAREAAQAAELVEAAARLKERGAELEALRKALETSEERCAESGSRCRELYDCNKRLEAHVTELETRKRAPLYQKKQEDELRATVEKAQEAEVRAVDAELRLKEARAEQQAAEHHAMELAEALAASARCAAEAAADAQEKLTLEVQRAAVERTRLQEEHAEAVASLQSSLAEVQAALLAAGAELDAQLAATERERGKVAELEQQAAELQAASVELQACANAASERVQLLESEAEAAAAAHEQALAAAAQAGDSALAAAQAAAAEATHALTQAHEQQHSALAAEMEAVKAKAAVDMALLEEELRSARERAELLVTASLDQAKVHEATQARIQDALATASQEHAAARGELKRQVDELSAKVAEAAGALRAKEELKEEKAKSRQEIAALKAELQKLQLESKTGAKGKDLALKEMDGAKKRIGDLETKLKVALQEKATAVNEKANFERQLKQHRSQTQTLQTTLEKKDHVESKKRESILVNLSKSKDALSATEQSLRAKDLELQRLGMDLIAKKSECTGLEAQLAETETARDTATQEVQALSMQLTSTQHALECLQTEHKEATGQLESAQSTLESLRTDLDSANAELVRLRAEHAALQGANTETAEALASLCPAHEVLNAQFTQVSEQLATLHAAHVAAHADVERMSAELAAAKEGHAQAEDARLAAEARMPELQELQRQLALTAEELADLQYSAAQQQTAAQADLQAAQEECTQLTGQLSAMCVERNTLLTALEAVKREAAATAVQLADATELYAGLQEQHNTLLVDKASLESQLAHRTAAATQAEERMQSLLKERARLQAALHAAEAEAQAASSAVESTANAAEARVQELNAQLQDAEARATAAQASAAQALVSIVASAEAGSDAGEQQAAAMEQLRSQLADALAAKAKAESELAVHAAQASAPAASTVSAAEVLELQTALLQAVQRRDTFEAEALSLRAQLMEAQQAAAEAAQQASQPAALSVPPISADEVTQMHAQIAELQKQLDELSQELISQEFDMNEQLAAAKIKVQELESWLQAAVARAADAEAQAGVSAHALERQLQQVAALQGHCAAVQEQLVAAEAAALAAQENSMVAPAEVVTSEQIVQEEVAERKDADADAQLQGKLLSVEAALQQAQQAHADIQEQLKELTGRYERTYAELLVSQATLAEAQLRVSNAEREAFVLNERLAGKQQETVNAASIQALDAPMNDATALPNASDDESAASIAALQDELFQAAAAKASIEKRLDEALAGQHALERQRDQLMSVIDELSVQVASTPTVAEPTANDADELQQLREAAASAAAIGEHAASLQMALDASQAATEAMQAAAEQLRFKLEAADVRLQSLHEEQEAQLQLNCEAAKRYEAMRSELQAAKEQLLHAQQAVVTAAEDVPPSDIPSLPPPSGGAYSAHETVAALQAQCTLQERELSVMNTRCSELELEMSEVQASANRMVAEKATLERSLQHRMLELETANLALQDELAAAQRLSGVEVEGGESKVAEPRADFAAGQTDREALQAKVDKLQVALENAVQAKEHATSQLQASLTKAQTQGSVLEARLEELDIIHKQLSADCVHAVQEASMLRDALTEAVAAKQRADTGASARAEDSERALCALLGQLDELTARSEALTTERDAQVADAAALRVALQKERQACQEHAAQGETLQARLANMEQHLVAVLEQSAVSEQIMAQAQGQLEALQAQVSDGHAVQARAESAAACIARMERELASARDSLAAVHATEAQLMQANALLEAQVRELAEAQTAGAHDNACNQAALAAARDAAVRLEQRLLASQQAYDELHGQNAELASALQQAEALAAAGQGGSGAQAALLARLAAAEELCAAAKAHVHEMEQRMAATKSRAESLSHELGLERARSLDALDEERLAAKQREAELNAEKLALESQIHWLKEQAESMTMHGGPTQAPAAAAAAVPDASALERITALESELRRAKRAEQKLQAMLYRLRKDVETAVASATAAASTSAAGHGTKPVVVLGLEAFDKLRDVRSLEYDADMLGQKAKRFERATQQLEIEKRTLLQKMANAGLDAGIMAGATGAEQKHCAASMSAVPGMSSKQGVAQHTVPALKDKENMPMRYNR